MTDAGSQDPRHPVRQQEHPAQPVRSADAVPGTRAIQRADLGEIIRRAAELALTDADPHEQLSEDEVLRIAAELGLSTHHVQRAMYEKPELEVPPRWYDRYYGPAILSVGRVVPGQTGLTLRRVEDYLVTREYLQIVRRRNESLAFVPADDTLSSVARALFRPSSRHIVSRARRVLVGAHTMQDDSAHVRFDIDLSEARSEAVQAGVVLGGLVGVMSGTGVAALSAFLLPDTLGYIPHIFGFGGGFLATIAGGFALSASSFRERVSTARAELLGLLDRLETGASLDPPPAPWRRRLQGRFFGEKS